MWKTCGFGSIECFYAEYCCITLELKKNLNLIKMLFLQHNPHKHSNHNVQSPFNPNTLFHSCRFKLLYTGQGHGGFRVYPGKYWKWGGNTCWMGWQPVRCRIRHLFTPTRILAQSMRLLVMFLKCQEDYEPPKINPCTDRQNKLDREQRNPP